MKATWILFGAPCRGRYDADSAWPPPRRIRALVDAAGDLHVLDRPADVPLIGEETLYELRSFGMNVSGPGAGHAFATYMRAGELARPLRRLEAVPA